MNKIIYLLLLIFTQSIFTQPIFGQEKVVKKPENVIIINNEIVTMAQVEKYGNEGYIKGMNKGVSENERNELAKKFGDKIGDKEFIIMISLFTEKEKMENDKKDSLKANENENINANIKENKEYILNCNH